ncbi:MULTISPECIES: WD40 repeat domain-containing protein [unclassified Microcoleus]|uniref:WD40 repeat domain-containing protein n=1 Tax=unclassified Microcoleus TaxID=2642155 RepID=UPI002FD58049
MMKILKSGNWKRKALWIPVAIAVILLGNDPWEVFPFVQYRRMYCSHDAVKSSYCNFSLFRTLEGHPTVSAIAIGADGQTLVSGGQDRTIKVWELQTGKLKKTLRSDSGAINDLAIAPDGKTVVSGSGDRLVRIWDITSDRPPQILKGHSGSVLHLRIASDGKTVISVADGIDREIKVWDIATGKQKAILPYTHFDDISPDGKTVLFTLPSSKLVAWDVTTNQQQVLQKFFSPSSDSARISLDGQTLVSIKQTGKRSFDVEVSDLRTGKINAKKGFSREIFRIFNKTLSSNFLIGITPKGLTVWNLQTAELEAVLDGQPEQMSHLVVSPDGKLLAGITRDSRIKVLQRP